MVNKNFAVNKENSCPESDKWCWVVACASFWVNFCLLGVLRSSAVIFVALVDVFSVSREDAAWPSGIFGFCMCITGVASGYLSHYFSIRCIMMVGALVASVSVSLCTLATRIEHVTILYGALQGAGFGVIVPLSHVLLNRYFSRYRAVAMGIAYAGSSVGSFCFPPLAHWMLDEFGLDGTFLLLGGIMLHSVLGISFMKTPKNATSEVVAPGINGIAETPGTNSTDNTHATLKNFEEKESPGTFLENNNKGEVTKFPPENTTVVLEEGSRSHGQDTVEVSKLKSSCMLTVDVLTNPDFLLISTSFAIYFTASAIFLMVIIDFAQEKLIPSERGVFLVSAFSFGDFSGRLGCGWITDLKCVRRKTIVCGYLLAMGLMLMVVPLCCTYELLLTVSVALGLLNGSIVVNFSALLTECLGLHRLALAVGFSSSIIGVVAFLRPLIIGYFRDQNQSYDFLFVSIGVSQILVIIIWLLRSNIPKIKDFVFLRQK